MTTTPDPIRALAEAATPGPWKVILPGDVRWEHRRKFRCVAFSRRRDEPYATSPLRPDDAALIVAMRNGIEAILDERDALRAALPEDPWVWEEPDDLLRTCYACQSTVDPRCDDKHKADCPWLIARAASPGQGL
ncbi:MAG: hypothetical protein U0667_15425 [Chloroflexota bacterium]